MKPIQYKDGTDYIYKALRITKERSEELDYRCSLILHEYFRPTKNGSLPPTDRILKLYIQLAENEQELIYLAYFAGMKVEEIFGAELGNQVEEEED